MNRVIIPEENVKISTKAIHLDNVILNRIREERIEITMIEIAITRGLILIIIFIDTAEDKITIFLGACFWFTKSLLLFIELLGIFFSIFLFSLGVLFIFFYNAHYIVLLLIIELILLRVFLFLFFVFLGVFGLYGPFFFLLVIVCLGGFSVSFLVSISRLFGRDFWFFKFIL